jgi:hypothetical protein
VSKLDLCIVRFISLVSRPRMRPPMDALSQDLLTLIVRKSGISSNLRAVSRACRRTWREAVRLEYPRLWENIKCILSRQERFVSFEETYSTIYRMCILGNSRRALLFVVGECKPTRMVWYDAISRAKILTDVLLYLTTRNKGYVNTHRIILRALMKTRVKQRRAL